VNLEYFFFSKPITPHNPLTLLSCLCWLEPPLEEPKHDQHLKILEERGREENRAMHAKSRQDPLQPFSSLFTTRQAGACTPSTIPPHLSASGVNPSRLHHPCSGQGTGSSTSKPTPPLCPSDRASARNRSPAPRIVPRRDRLPARAPSLPIDPQPTLATSPQTRRRA
jgi:hypothetical protein